MRKVKTLKDLARAHNDVLDEVRKGNLTPTEGESMSRMLGNGAQIFEKAVLEPRVEDLARLARDSGQDLIEKNSPTFPDCMTGDLRPAENEDTNSPVDPSVSDVPAAESGDKES